jgi:hypothetical protein
MAPVGSQRVRVPQTGGSLAHSIDASEWRDCPRPRIPLREVGRPHKHSQLNMFYGIPENRIAEWRGVATSTAYAYETALLKPSKAAAKPFRWQGAGSS